MRRIHTLLLIMVICALMSGCAGNQYGTQQTAVNYYPACYDPIKKLRESEDSTTQGTVAGAALGAAGGAILGFLATGKAQGAVLGGLSGGVIGGVIGNQIAKNRKIADDNRRMAAYMQDLDGSISRLDIASASARMSLQCYDQQFKLLITAIQHRRVSYVDAQKMFNEIQAGTREASALLGTWENDGSDMEQQYRAALASEEQQLQMKRAPQQAHASLNQAQKRCDALQANVTKVKKQRAAADRQLKAQQDELSAILASSQA